MSISAIVPVWNGRELLARLLASLERRRAPARRSSWSSTTARRTALPNWRGARGARVIAMGRNAGFAAAVNRGIEEGRGMVAILNTDVELAPDYLEAARPAVNRRLSPRERFCEPATGPHRWHFRPDLPRRHRRGACGTGPPMGRLSTARARSVRRLGPPSCSAPSFFARWAAGGMLRILSGRCGFRVTLRRLGLHGPLCARRRVALAPRQRLAGTVACGNRAAHGTQPVLSGGAALSARDLRWPAHPSGPGPMGSGGVSAWRAVWPGCAASSQGLRHFQPRAWRSRRQESGAAGANSCEPTSGSFESCKPTGFDVLEVVFSADRWWGKVTHGIGHDSALLSSLITPRAEIGACLDAALATGSRSGGGG